MIRILKLIAANLCVTLFLLIGVELGMGSWFSRAPNENTDCFHTRYHHDYCPSAVHRRFMAGADGGQVVLTYVNKSGIAVADESQMDASIDVSQHDVIFIGDSFFQAEEVPYKQRIGQVFSELTGKNVLQIGYSSWSPLIMKHWLEDNPPVAGTQIHLFAMANDYLPISWSDIRYSSMLKKNETGTMSFVNSRNRREQLTPLSFIDSVTRKSFFLSRLKQVRKTYSRFRRKTDLVTPVFTSKEFSTFDQSCEGVSELTPYSKTAGGNIARNAYYYAQLARPYKCWSDDLKESAIFGLETLISLEAMAAQRGWDLRFYLIPAGWAFKDENLIGKSTNSYALANDVSFTQAGLVQFLKKGLQEEGVSISELFDLEKVIRKSKKPGEQWYFPVDGHWTEFAQSELGSLLSEYP